MANELGNTLIRGFYSMSEQAPAEQKSSTNQTSVQKAPVRDSNIKLPRNKNTTTVFEPASKVAVLGYN